MPGTGRFSLEYPSWLRRNFPNDDASRQLLGVVEEVGELAHAHLKGQQGIRHTPEEIRAMKVDAVADIVIFLSGYCVNEGIDLDEAVEKAWDTVRLRDWIANPMAVETDAQLSLEGCDC